MNSNFEHFDWAKLIQHIESGKANKNQIRLLLSVIANSLKNKQEFSDEFIEYISRVADRFSKEDITLDQALTKLTRSGRKGNQPAELGGMPYSISHVYQEMLKGTSKDSAINYIAAKEYKSASKLRDDINFYKKNFLESLILEKKLLNTEFTSKEINVIKDLIDPSFSTENL